MLSGLQRFLWAAGFAIFGYCGMASIHAILQQSEGNAELDHMLSMKPGPDKTQGVPLAPRLGGLVGRMEIPRLHVSAVVFEGADEPVLSRGVGHLPGSALPGQAGNVVLAGHRDSFFRALRNIRQGDVVEVTTEQGTRSYSVNTTEIISPAKVSVLEPTRTPTLTLVTCYPFYYVGNAPKRFIVRGEDMGTTEARQSTDAPVRPANYIRQPLIP
jgi:sortase A